MPRRTLLLLPAVLAALALPVTPALAGGGDDDDSDDSATATLRATQACVSGERAKVRVTGELIDSVEFFLDGDLVKTDDSPDSDDRYTFRMRCSRLSRGAHRGRAVVSFAEGASESSRTLRFQITRSRQASPRFTG
jgi:hypothetical protein